MNEPPALEFSRVSHAYPGQAAAVVDISLALAAGEFVTLVGPSGCGKSTLLRMAAGLLSPGEGTVTGPNPGETAFVFQDATLLPWRTAAENIALPLELQGVARSQQQTRVRENLDRVGLLPADAGKFPRQLSGGMKMRVALARALITQPRLLLLDEPLAALDDLLRQQLQEELLRLWQAQRWTTLVVTHNVSEAVYLSQRVIVMSARPGRLTAGIAIDAPYPRAKCWRTSAEFAALAAQVSAALWRDEA